MHVGHVAISDIIIHTFCLIDKRLQSPRYVLDTTDAPKLVIQINVEGKSGIYGREIQIRK